MSRDNSMMYDLGRVDRVHRAIARETFSPVLRRKRCACGAAMIAKELVQHGKCQRCRLTDGVDVNDLTLLRFALGAVDGVHPKSRWGARNQYCADSTDLPAMRRLQVAGLVEEVVAHAGFGVFKATRKGGMAIGMSAAAIARTFSVPQAPIRHQFGMAA